MTTPEPASTSIDLSEPREGFVAVGRVLGAWGVHGACRLESLSDFPDRFSAGARLWIGGNACDVEHCHWRRGTPIVKLSGFDTHAAAAALRGRLVELPESELHPLAENEYYQHDLVGLKVRTSAGDEIGVVNSLLPTGANDVLVVKGAVGEYLLPLIEDVVLSVDLRAGLVVVELLEGLEAARHKPERASRDSRARPSSRRRSGAITPASPSQARPGRRGLRP